MTKPSEPTPSPGWETHPSAGQQPVSWGQQPPPPPGYGYPPPHRPLGPGRPAWGAPKPPAGGNKGKRAAIGCAAILATCTFIGIVSAIASSGENSGSTTGTTVSAGTDATAATSADDSTGGATTDDAASPAAKPATAAARKQAAAILKAEDQRFRDQLAKGQRVVGTPDFTAWYQTAIVGFGTDQAAFKRADALFTADNEPTDLLEAWRWHNGNADGAISTFAQDGTAMDAPDAKTRQDAKDALAELAKADSAADRLAAGK